MPESRHQAVAILPPDLEIDGFVRNVGRIARQLGIDCSFYCPVYEAALNSADTSPGSSLDVARQSFLKSIGESLKARISAGVNGGDRAAVQIEWVVDATAGAVRALADRAPWLAFVPERLATARAPTLAFGQQRPFLGESPVPVWVVLPGPAIDVQPNILVAVDATAATGRENLLNDRLVEEAIEVAEETRGRIHLIAVYRGGDPVTRVVTRRGPENADAPDDERRDQECRNATEALAQRHRIPAEQVHVRRGDLAAAVRELAAPLGIGLLILGRSEQEALLAGHSGQSLSDLLDLSPTDVLVVDKT